MVNTTLHYEMIRFITPSPRQMPGTCWRELSPLIKGAVNLKGENFSFMNSIKQKDLLWDVEFKFLSGHCIDSGFFLRFAFVLLSVFCKTSNFCLLNLKYITVTGLKHMKEASTCLNSQWCTTLQSPNTTVCRCRSHLGKIMFFVFLLIVTFASVMGFKQIIVTNILSEKPFSYFHACAIKLKKS